MDKEECYSLRAHKNLRDDLEASAKGLGIDYKIIDDGDEVVITILYDHERAFCRGLFLGKWVERSGIGVE